MDARVIEGSLDASGLRFAIVVSRFNAFVTEKLAAGAVDFLVRSGAQADDITVIKVPGAWELPGAAAKAVDLGDVDAVIALGCLMRGDTIHFDLIAKEVSSRLASLAMSGDVPVAFGVITTETLEQAIDRAGAKAGNKGVEAASAAVEMARVYRAMEGK